MSTGFDAAGRAPATAAVASRAPAMAAAMSGIFFNGALLGGHGSRDGAERVCDSTIARHTRLVRNQMPKIAFVGAGSVEFTRNLLGDILAFPALAESEISLHDIDPERLETAELLAHRVAETLGTKPKIASSLNRREALDCADYVINSIQVGGHAATVRDHEIPARHGVRQTIGDTLGIGGIIRTLRTAPVMLGIGDDMAEVCPGAWLLNYTNPMAMICQLVYQGTPQQNVVGLCHSVQGTMEMIAGLCGVPVEEVTYFGAGINHQTFLYRLEHGGESLYPKLDEAIERNPDLLRRVRVDMYRRLGYFPTESSEHSAEYSPWYMRHDSEIERLRIPVGDLVGRGEEGLEEYERVKRELAAGHAARDRAQLGVRLADHQLDGDRRAVRDLRQRAQHGADHEPARRHLRRGAVPGRPHGRQSDARGRCRAAVRGAQPHLRERLRPDRARGARRADRPRPARRDARPQHRGEPHAGRHRRPRGRDARRLPRLPAGVAALGDDLTPAELVSAAIDAAAHEGPAVVVGIDGPSGAGKSTLAAELALLRDDIAIIEGDDFYRPLAESTRAALTPLEAVDLLFDWERLRDEALAPLVRGEEARYRRYDWDADRLGEEVAAVGAQRRRAGRGLLRRAARAARLPRRDRRSSTPRATLCIARQLARGDERAGADRALARGRGLVLSNARTRGALPTSWWTEPRPSPERPPG